MKTTNAERVRKFNKSNPERRRELTREYTRRARKAAVELLGNKCCKCGIDDVRVLQIDHIHGGGTRELEHNGGGSLWNKVIRSVLNKEDRYQLLCSNCNWIKRHENKEAVGRPILIKS